MKPDRLHKKRQSEWAALCAGAGKQFAKLERKLKLTPAQIEAIKAKGYAS